MPSTPQATIVITTKNRQKELKVAVESALSQTANSEVMVVDDGSTDGTADMVRTAFPNVCFLRSPESLGLIIQRNRAAFAAKTEIIVSLDDDAEFSSRDIVSCTLDEFDHPRVGAVAIPHVDTRSGTIVNTRAPRDGGLLCVASFTGTAYAIRRSTFLALGGFRQDLVHQGEEADYCVRMLSAGYIVRLGGAEPILHHESPRRSFDRMDFYGRRNDVLFAWHNVPRTRLVPHLLATTLNGLRSAARTRRLKHQLRGILNGWSMIFDKSQHRAPVGAAVYQLFRTLKKRGPVRLTKIEHLLPSIQESVTIPEG